MKDNLRVILALFDRDEPEEGLKALREMCEGDSTDAAIASLAANEWENDNLVVDGDAIVSRSDEHAWVSAWVCVDLPDNLKTVDE